MSGTDNFYEKESRLRIFLDHCTALVLTNIMWLICCIPVVTAGPATRAMFANLRDHLDGGVCTGFSFLRHMKKDFLRSCLLGLFLLAMGAVLFLGAAMAAASGSVVMLGLVGSVGLMTTLFGSTVFPLMTQVELSARELILTAATLCVGGLPRTLPAAALNLMPVVLILFFTDFFAHISVFWALLGFALVAMLDLKLLEPIFNRVRS